MADEIGRAALTIGGAAIFGPVGAVVGGILGDILFPVEAGKGPRLNELNVQHSTVGAPIPIVYGTARLAGNVIWSGGLIETEHEGESAGKGGPSGPTTYTYSVDIAIGISEGPISGIRRIWGDADLLFDSSSDEVLTERLGNPPNVAELIAGIRAMSAQLDFELYLGTEDQLPDPTIESYEPAGTVPAYRGLAYIVLPAFALERFGNRIPNFTFEIYSGTPTECGLYSAGQLLPWNDGATRDPRFDEGSYQYFGDSTWRATLAEAIADTGLDLVPASIGWSESSGDTQIFPPCSSVSTENVNLFMMLNFLEVGSIVCEIPGVEEGSFLCGSVRSYAGTCNAFYWQGKYTSQITADQAHGFWGIEDPDDCSEASMFGGFTQPGDFDCPEGRFAQFLTDTVIGIRRTTQPPDPCALGTPLTGAPGYCTVNGQVVQGITWTEVAGTFHVLQEYHQTGVAGVVDQYPVGPAVISTDPLYNDEDYWEAAYADALAAGEPIAPGLVYGVDYPQTQSFAYFSECDTVDTACVPEAIIIADICRRAGLRTDTSTQIDVSGITSCVPGYIIGRQMSARDALGPLRMFGLWDATESQAILRFVERGAAIVETLTADDLGAHENGSQAPTAVEVSRVQEKDLPRRVRLHFANFLHDHEPSEQSASRLATEAIDEVDVELPISMEPDTAAQLAEIMLFAQWTGRNTYRFSLDNNRLALEPTDCIEIPVDGQTERVRIVAVNYKIGGILEIDAQRDDDGSYISTATGDPSAPSGGLPGSGGNGPICPSEVVLLDIPCLQDSHGSDAGYYAAIYGLCPETWNCAELYRSNDGGATFGRVARTDRQATVGEIDDITGPPTDVALLGESPQYDESNSITVTLFNGTLASITDAQIAAGFNAAAIGVDGRWVIIQYKTATLSTENTWVLTDLIWGLRDTGHNLGTTVAGDTFVWLNSPALLRIPETPESIGVAKDFKVPTCGESLDAVLEFSFTTWGLCYQRLCPATVLSCSTTSPPTGAVDGDAYYLPNDTSLTGVWETHGGEIATWSDETDSWVFCTPAAGTIVHCDDEDVDVIPPGGGGDPTPAPWQRVIEWQDEGVAVADTGGTIDTVNFVGPGVTATLDSSGVLEVNVPGGGGFDTSGDVELALDQLTDVTIGSPLAEGDVLVYDGTNGWINLPLEDVPGAGGGGTVVEAFQAAQSSSATNAALTTSQLTVTLAVGRWWIEMVIFTTSNTTADMRDRYNFTGTANTTNTIARFISAGAATPVANDTGINNTSLAFNTNTNNRTMIMGTLDVSVSGTFSYQFSQDTLSAPNPVFVQIGSYVRCTLMGSGGGGGGGGFTSPLTTKGDLHTYTTTDARLGVGTTGDTVIADSSTSTGLNWGVPGIPSNPQTGNYTIVAADNGRAIDHASGAGAGDTYTIPANGTLALPLGFTFSVSNMDSNALTVAITTDTLRKAGAGSTGSVSVAQYGTATFRKVATTEWLWTGVGAT